MKTAIPTLSLILALATGCSSTGGMDGTWVLYLDTPDVNTDLNISENYLNGVPNSQQEPTSSSDRVVETTYEESETIQIVRIIGANGSNAFLDLDGLLLPGARVAGVWEFEWTDTVESTRDVQDADYHYERVSLEQNTVHVSFDPSGGEVTGTITVRDDEQTTYSENDLWGYEGPSYSSVPSDDYLEVVSSGFGYVVNDEDVQDCSSSNCELGIARSTTFDVTFTGQRTDLAPEDQLFEGGGSYDNGWDTGW